MSVEVKNVLILGAAGRDFHNFNVHYRNNPGYRVVGFTAAQIPDIAGRTYPASLAGHQYPKGIPIFSEDTLIPLIKEYGVREVVFAYSDVTNQHVMTLAAQAMAAGADFTLLGPDSTMLKSKKPVISVCAVRTGCGKSQTTRAIADQLMKKGKRVAVIRHPMPYGDLAKQKCEKFTTLNDLKKYNCTIEEREEYEQHIEKGHLLFAGVDYQAILHEAEKEADIILWDGGNNDLPFYRPTLHIVLVDPHRPGHELNYYPSLANLLMADVVVMAKSQNATEEGRRIVSENVKRLNHRAIFIEASSVVHVANPEAITGKRVLVIEDGPTLTHGGMPYGAGTVAANQYKAAEIVDPAPFSVGSIRETLRRFPHIRKVLPAMGYHPAQIADLAKSIALVPCDTVVVGTPVNLKKLMPEVDHPFERVRYDLDKDSVSKLMTIIDRI